MEATQPAIRPPVTTLNSRLTGIALSGTINAGTGALAAWAFSLIEPPILGGAVFGLVQGATSATIRAILDKAISSNTSTAYLVKTSIAFILSNMAAATAASAAGFTITFNAAVVLTATMILTSITIKFLLFVASVTAICCACCCACFCLTVNAAPQEDQDENQITAFINRLNELDL